MKRLENLIGAQPLAMSVAVAAAAIFGVIQLENLLKVGRAAGYKRALPAEYIYLDVARVDAYLGQLENGLSTSEKKSLTDTETLSASVNPGELISVGGSKGRSKLSERTVTASEGDRFYQLLNQLHDSFKEQLYELDIDGGSGSLAQKARAIPEGDFVEIKHARLAIPSFALAVPKLSFGVQALPASCGQAKLRAESSEQTREESCRRVSQRTVAKLIAHHPRDVRRYLKGFGEDPHFVLSTRAAAQEGNAFTVLLPILYGDLTNSSSLVGDNLTIVGKVIDDVRESATAQPEKPSTKQATRADTSEDVYYEEEAAIRYRSALENVPPDVRRALKLPRHLGPLISELVSVRPPGIVILPVAIYS